MNGEPVMGNEDYLRGYNDAINRCRHTLEAAFNEPSSHTGGIMPNLS